MGRSLAPAAVAGAVLTLGLAVPAVAVDAPPRPHDRTLTWQCDDGTVFTTARPSRAANASPVVGTTQVWLQMRTTLTFDDGTTSEQVWGGDAPGVDQSTRLLTCTTTSGTTHVEVVGLLI